MEATDAIARFLEGLDPQGEVAARAVPFTLEVDSMAGDRVADVALLLGLIAAFWGIGRLLRSAGMAGLRPFVFASALTGVLLLFFTNTAFWMVAGVSVDADKITLQKHLGDDEVLAWAELRGVELDSGKLFPAFSDDASLVLRGAGDQRLALPRFVPGIADAAREVQRRLPKPPAQAPDATRDGGTP